MRRITAVFITVVLVCMPVGNCFAVVSDYYPPHESVNGSHALQNMPEPLTIDNIGAKYLVADHNFDDDELSSDTMQYSYISGEGVSFDDGALKIVKTSANDAERTQVKFKFSGKVDTNAHYAFSCRIKCEGVINEIGAPRNLIEAYGTKDGLNNKWLAQAFAYDGHKYEEGDTDWYTVCQMMQPPEDTDYFILSAYVNAGTEGTIYFDDFKLYKFAIDPMDTVLISPSYKGLIFEEGNADISLDVILKESEFYSLGDMCLELKLVDVSGITVRFASADVLSEKMNFTFSSKGLPLGDYYIQAILKNVKTGENVSFKEHTIRRTDTYPETYLNKKGNLVRNGETKFFKKLYSYNGTVSGTTYQEVAEDAYSAGVDSISQYSMWWAYGGNALSSAMEYMRNNDLMMHLSLKEYWWSNYGERSSEFESFVEKQEDIFPFLTKIANNYKDNDILDGYYLFDEPNPVYEGEEIRWNNEIISEADINHPTYGVADKDFDRYGIYTKMTDVLGIDPYPIYGEASDDIAKVGRSVREAKKNFPNRPLYLVLQCFNWGVGQNDSSMRGPTYSELRNMAWQGICEGVVGLDAFSYPSMKNDISKSFDEWWSDLTSVYDEVEQYGEVIISEEPSPLYSVSDNGDWLNILVKRFEGKTYIFAVNNTKQEKSACINVSGAEAQNLNFDPLEVKIITLEHSDYLSPEAELMALEFSNASESFAVAENNGKKLIFLPVDTEKIGYAARISDGAKLYINGNECETCGTLEVNNADSITVTVVAEDRITSNTETYEVYSSGGVNAYSYKPQKYVAVTGNAGIGRTGKNVVLMLVKKNADMSNIGKSDIGYITQTKIKKDGSYSFEFEFSDFTYDSFGNVDNYMIIVNTNGVRISDTVTKAVEMSELVAFEIDISQESKAIANVTNSLGLKDLRYTMLLGFYNHERLLDVKMYDKYIGDINSVTYDAENLPDGTTHIKAFVWENTESLIPLAPSKTKEVHISTQ